jgi:asparagine synthase (glutamine-hydrolysing)
MAQMHGCVLPGDPARVRNTIDAMGRAQQRRFQSAADLWIDEDGGVGLGCLTDREVGRLGTFGADRHAHGAWVLDGEVYRLSVQARSVVGAPVRDLAAAIPLLYEAFGSDFVKHLDGSFCIALYDASRRTLLVANDHFSTRTMYWTQAGGRLLFASELKALIATPFVSRRLDVTALSQAFAFNRILGEHTLLEDVRRLQPATIVEYDISNRRVELREYWRADADVIRRHALDADRTARIVESFRDAVRVRVPENRRIAVSLSGGLDSRAVVAVLADDKRHAFTCTTGIAGCADQHIAKRIARVASTTHSFYELKREQIESYLDALRAAVFSVDGMMLVGGFPGGLTQKFCEDTSVDVLLRGHGGENARLGTAWPFQVNETVLRMPAGGDVRPYVRSTLWTAPKQMDWSVLFAENGVRPSPDLANDSLDAIIGRFRKDLTAAETLNLLYLTQNDGNAVPTTRNGLRGYTEMALPYLDYEFMSLVLGTDARQRCGSDIHLAIVRTCCPALVRVANSNTGAPLDASPLRLAATDKLNAVLRRLQLPRFRHYHYMEQWIKGFLADEVRAIALDERTIARGMFTRRCLTDLVEEGTRNASMSRLLNLIVNLEIWCRLFLDGDALALRHA